MRRLPSRSRSGVEQSEKKTRLERGAFGKPKPSLFRAEYGRPAQRAFRDTVADLVPPEHGWKPTLRIGDFEILGWIYTRSAEARMRELLPARLGLDG